MTTNPLDAIQARADAATEGPWACEPLGDIVYPSMPWSVFSHEANDDGDYPSVTDDSGDLVLTKADAVFIAHAREDVPKLVRALREVETIMDQLDIDRVDGRIVMPSQIQQAVRDTIREALG